MDRVITGEISLQIDEVAGSIVNSGPAVMSDFLNSLFELTFNEDNYFLSCVNNGLTEDTRKEILNLLSGGENG